VHCVAPHRAGVVNGAYSFAGRGLFGPVSNLLVDPGGRAHYDSPPPRAPADHHRRAVGITVMVAAASFAIFQVNLPFAGGDLADCSAHTERVIQ